MIKIRLCGEQQDLIVSAFAKGSPFSISSITGGLLVSQRSKWKKVDDELVKEAVIKIEGFRYNSYNAVSFNLARNRIAPW